MSQASGAIAAGRQAEDVRRWPRIGITLMLDLPERDTHAPRFSMARAYFDVIRSVGGVPIALTPGCAEEMQLYVGKPTLTLEKEELPLSLLRLDGLCLAGGGDLHPSYYGQEKSPLCIGVDPERDEMEMTLLSLVRDTDLPVLAICRGIQVLNAFFGGTVIQDIGSECPGAGEHDFQTGYEPDYIAHEIRIDPGSLLHGILGSTSIGVNSAHHQAVDRVAEALVATARAPDGVVEGLEVQPSESGDQGSRHQDHGGRFLVGVQFHPERVQGHGPMRRLFERLVDAAWLYRQRARTAGHSNPA